MHWSKFNWMLQHVCLFVCSGNESFLPWQELLAVTRRASQRNYNLTGTWTGHWTSPGISKQTLMNVNLHTGPFKTFDFPSVSLDWPDSSSVSRSGKSLGRTRRRGGGQSIGVGDQVTQLDDVDAALPKVRGQPPSYWPWRGERHAHALFSPPLCHVARRHTTRWE